MLRKLDSEMEIRLKVCDKRVSDFLASGHASDSWSSALTREKDKIK